MQSAYEVVEAAFDTFRTFQDGDPDLVSLGIPYVDRIVGGVSPGTLVCLAAATGVGKSNMALSMLTNSKDVGAYLSCEDPEDVLGVRMIAAESNVSSLAIRKKQLAPYDFEQLKKAHLALRERKGLFKFLIGGSINQVEKAVKEAGEGGAKFCILDYLQKIRGNGDDRRNEVGRNMNIFQRACSEQGMVPILISQLVRTDPTRPPTQYQLKESGDIENEARLIILGHRDSSNHRLIHWRIAKSTFGGAGEEFQYEYNNAGTLVPCSGTPDEEEF